MAQRLDLWMRTRFEVLSQQGLPNAEIGECLGRSRATVCEGEETLRSGRVLRANCSK